MPVLMTLDNRLHAGAERYSGGKNVSNLISRRVVMRIIRVVMLLTLGVLLTVPEIGRTAPIASSSAFGESVNLVFVASGSGLSVPVTLTSGPLPTAVGSAPPPYNVTNNLSTVTVGTALQAGPLMVTAASTLPLSLNVMGSATLSNVALDIAPLFTLTATQIQSTTMIDAFLNATGTTTILAGASMPNVNIPSAPAPNTVLVNAGGVRVVLNEQTISGNGVTSRDISTNAVDVTFSNAPFASATGPGLLNGTIILLHSEAHVQGAVAAVPEPASFVLLGTGLAVVWHWRRRCPR
jgi:hypothetical protein